VNRILTKDLIGIYRKDKKDWFSLLVLTIFSGVYSIFIINGLQSKTSIISIVQMDNIFLTILMVFLVIGNYQFKSIIWYSGEDRHLQLFKKLKIHPLRIYRAKKRVSHIVLLPLVLLYGLIPLFFLYHYSLNGIIYAAVRILPLVMYASVIIEYPLIHDARKKIVRAYKNHIFMRSGDLIMVIVLVQGIGLSLLISLISNQGMLNNHHLLYWLLFGVVFLILAVIKLRYFIIRKSFKREEVS